LQQRSLDRAALYQDLRKMFLVVLHHILESSAYTSNKLEIEAVPHRQYREDCRGSSMAYSIIPSFSKRESKN
jgi:hypothetical protein